MAKINSRYLQHETNFQGKYARSLLDTLYQSYKPVLGWTLLFLILGLVGRFFLLGNANLIGYWVDSFCVAPASCRPVPDQLLGFDNSDFLTLLSLATGLGFLLTVTYRIAISRLSADAVSRIYDETTLRTSRLPISFFDRNPAGRIMTRFASDYNNIFRIFGGPLAEFIGLTFDLLAMTVLITVASPFFLPFWVLQAAVNYGVYRRFLPALRKERREMALKRSPSIAHFAETAQGASTIRAYGRQRKFHERFTFLNDQYLSQRLQTNTVFIKFSFAMSVVTVLNFLVLGIASVWLVSQGYLSVGSIGVAFAYLGLSSHVLQSFFEWLGQFEEAMTGLERMDEYLRLPLEPGLKLPAHAEFQTGQLKEEGKVQARIPANWDGIGEGASIEICKLSMRYRPELPLVLKSVDLSVSAGERLAVIGKTGSGKTSLVQALFRLYPIEDGCIRISGREARLEEKNVEDLDLRTYRTFLSYITQDAVLFLGTIRENLNAPGALAGGIAGAQAHLTDSALIQALRRVHFLRSGATDEEYLHWLEYKVEERGRNLSAGERQLICMARCLLQDSPVVVFDEATSAVDPQSEEILTRATEEFFRGKTQIIIAHRLSTIRSCDRVLWMDNGQVHRLGPPDVVLPEFEHSSRTD